MKRILIAVAIMATTALSSFAADHPAGAGGPASPNPQHLLVMAHHKNVIAFGKALAKVARQGETVPRDFARTAIAEMKRSVEEIEKYRAECSRTMAPCMNEQMQKMMDEHLVKVKTDLRELENLAKGDRIPSQEVTKHLQFVFEGCGGPGGPMGGRGMYCREGHPKHGPGMHCGEGNKGMDDCRCGNMNQIQEHRQSMNEMMQKMKAADNGLARQVEKMKRAPKDKKVDLLSDIVARMVQQRADLTAHMEKMQQHRMHGGDMRCMDRGASMAPPPMMRGMGGQGPNDEDEDTEWEEDGE